MFSYDLKRIVKNKIIEYSPSNASIHKISILIAYSGGVDSSVLLDIINSLSNEMKFKYDFVYINHSMNENSNHIREFANNFSKKNKTNFIYHEINKKPLKNKESFFREYRYAYLNKLKIEYGYNFIFTAHHHNDQIETIYMKTRGRFDWTNLLGVRESIKEIRRPFLRIKKNRIIDYATRNGVFWVFDNTNNNNNFLRNNTRNLVLPRNKKRILFLSILHTYSRLKFYLFKRKIKQLKNRIILKDDRWIVLNKNYFLKLNSTSKKIFLQTILKKYNDDKYLILKNSKWSELWNYLNKNKNLKDFVLNNNIFITNSRDLVVIRCDEDYEKKMFLNNDVVWDDYMFKVSKDTRIKKQEALNNQDSIFIDISLFSKGLFLRNWRIGDSYLDKKNNKKRVSKLFLKNKFNNYQKMSHPIMVDSNDNIVWVPGLAAANNTASLSAKNNCIKISKEILN